jgi:AcrR family transcriptional regulator
MEAARQPRRAEVREAFLDAAERMLIEVGYAGISTRRLAEEAGANHGLVHYYFGSMEELLLQVLERFTDRLIERQRAMYAADVPFIEKWRNAMRFMEEDLAAGYPKVWVELQALAWNRPELQDRVSHVLRAWHEVLTEAFTKAHDEYGLDRDDFPPAAMVALVRTFNAGMLLERLSGVSYGHEELLEAIDAWLLELEERKGKTG